MDYVFATQTCSVGYDGGVIHLKRGQAWDARHKLVKQRPDFFSKEPPVVHGRTALRDKPVEDATAEPGKKRRTR